MPFITKKNLASSLQENWKVGFKVGFRTALLGEVAYFEALLPQAFQGMDTHFMDLGLSREEAYEALKITNFETYMNDVELTEILPHVIFQRYLSLSNNLEKREEKIAKIRDEIESALQRLPIL
jgi:hypothetical protein